MSNTIRVGALFAVLLLVTVGCATKNYVREALGTQQSQIDQRFDTMEGRVSEESQRVGSLEGQVSDHAQRIDGVGARVQTLETSVGQVGDAAKGAQNRADSAFSKADDVNNRLTTLWTNRNARTPVETIDVLFGFNHWNLSDRGENTLATLVKELKENDKLVVELTGYADQTGPREYNIQLSQRRVEAVRRYLVEKGVDLWRIQSVGMGSILDRSVPKEKKRRVTVTLASLE